MKIVDVDDERSQGYRIRAVVRALDVLVAVGELGRSDLSTLAREVGLHPTTTLRMLESLRSRDLVRHRTGKYEIGPGAFEIGCRFLDGMSFVAEAQVLLDELADEVNETSSLGILEGGDVLYLAIAHGRSELGIQSLPGGRHPAYCTALGKAMLSELPPDEVRRVLDETPPVALTPATIVDLHEMSAELAQCAERGYAVDAEERVPGVVCVAAPIRDQSGAVIAAVSVSGPGIRVTPERLPGLAAEVMATAQRASVLLGAPMAGARQRA